MRLLVTGASGHLGLHVVRDAAARGHDVIAVSRREIPRESLPPGASPQRLEGDPEISLANALASARPDVVVHAAWAGVTGPTRNALASMHENLRFTGALLGACESSQVRVFIGVGSQAEYGVPPERPVVESDAANPVTTYGVAKDMARRMASHVCKVAGMRFAWMRLFATYGPCDHPGNLIPTMLSSLLENRSPMLTPGDQRWDYLYVEDAAAAICRVAGHPAAEGVFNLCSGVAPTIAEIARLACKVTGATCSPGLGAVPYPAGQIMHLQGDCTRLQAVLDWRPRVPLDEGLRRTVEHLRHPGLRPAIAS